MSAPAPAATCVVILSDKSSGSSILQAELRAHPAISGLAHTPHQEGETLFWNKAAALLGRPQGRMVDSSVLPMRPADARRALLKLCVDNLAEFLPPEDDRSLVFEGWRALVMAHRPVFLEKSPHHLHYSSALELLLEAEHASPDITYRFIGLVRDPVDTLHSMWSRWRVPPDLRQHEWVRAYRNLIEVQKATGDKFRLVRYEALVAEPAGTLNDLWRFIGLEGHAASGSRIIGTSVGRGRADHAFAFSPSPSLIELGAVWGYSVDPVVGKGTSALRRLSQRAAHSVRRWRRRQPFRRVAQRL